MSIRNRVKYIESPACLINTIAVVFMLLTTVSCATSPFAGLDVESQKLARTSGAMADVKQNGFSSTSTILFGVAPTQYDEGAREFRIGVKHLTKNGTKIDDFFSDLEYVADLENNCCTMVGYGNAELPVPKLLSWHLDNNKATTAFASTFPELIDKDFHLTFKEFSGNAYYLRDVPAGTAFIWIQTAFDGNRVTQYPMVVELRPEPGKAIRQDIISVTGRDAMLELFHDL